MKWIILHGDDDMICRTPHAHAWCDDEMNYLGMDADKIYV